MSTLLTLDTPKHPPIPVEHLRTLHPLLVSGLHATQIRTRQATYRFLLSSGLLTQLRFLSETQGVELLGAMDFARENYEASTFLGGMEVRQVMDLGDVLGRGVEEAKTHVATCRAVWRGGGVEWIWRDHEGGEYGMGTEEVFTDVESAKACEMLRKRVCLLQVVLLM